MALKHENLTDSLKHTPKNFDSALVGESAFKNELGENEYASAAKLPDVLNIVDSLSAPPTEVNGDIYALTNLTDGIGRQEISAINWQSGTTVRATFDVGYDLTNISVGMYIYIQNSDETIQNGRFVITAKGTGTIDYTNDNVTSAANDEASSPAYASFGHANWDGGTSGDWIKFNSTDGVWYPVKMGNGTTVYNLTDGNLYYQKNSLSSITIVGSPLV
jgi:hypothetical protein